MERKKDLRTLLGIAAGMVVLSFVFRIPIFLYLAIALCTAGLFSTRLAAFIAGLWTKATNLVGYAINAVLLSLVFFILLTPLALVRKITGKSPILLRPTQGDSYFHIRNHKYEKSDLQDMW